jgi:hypothetical protein
MIRIIERAPGRNKLAGYKICIRSSIINVALQ